MRRIRRPLLIATLASVLMVMALPPGAWAAGPSVLTASQKLVSATRVDGDRFGNAVGVSGDWAIIGAPEVSGGKGAVSFATRSRTGWGVTQRLLGLEAGYAEVGYSVAISGDTAVVGAPYANTEAGRVHVLVRQGLVWVPQAVLTASDANSYDHFGWSVAIDGNTVVVGAPGKNSDTGRAYAFVRSGTSWSQQEALIQTDGANDDNYGHAVAVSGDTALVGSPMDDDLSSDGGTVYVWTRGGSDWTLRAELVSPSSDDGDQFGTSVALDGATAVIGAPYDDSATVTNCGSAFVLTGSGSAWAQQARLWAPVPGASELLGYSVGIDGDIAVVGAPQDDFQGFWSGGAYYYLRAGTAWSVGAGLARPEIAAYDNYGNAVDVQGGTAFVGSIRDDSYRGSAYAYFTPKTVVHRFYNPGAGTHFYTDSAEEAWTVLVTWPDIFTYEGVAYTLNPALNTQVLYRFYKPSSASHFYTASLAEKNQVVATLSHIYAYEGTTYSVSPAYAVGKPPVYRFYNVRNGSHFFTISAAEKAHIQATWPHIYTYEGIAFWLGQ